MYDHLSWQESNPVGWEYSPTEFAAARQKNTATRSQIGNFGSVFHVRPVRYNKRVKSIGGPDLGSSIGLLE